MRANDNLRLDRSELHLVEKGFIARDHTVEDILAGALLREGQRRKDRAERIKRRGDNASLKVIKNVVAAKPVELDLGPAILLYDSGIMTP